MIRLMTIEDYYDVYQLWEETQEVSINEKDDTYKKIETFLNWNPNLCMVAVEDGYIVGSLMAGYDGRRGHIYHTVVKSEFRKKGIGSQLVDKIIQEFHKLDVNEVDLIAKENNIIGNEFWEKRGFLQNQCLNYRRKVIEKNEK